MRRIGRLRSEASPSKGTGMPLPAGNAHHQPRAGAGIAEIEHLVRLAQRRQRRP